VLSALYTSWLNNAVNTNTTDTNLRISTMSTCIFLVYFLLLSVFNCLYTTRIFADPIKDVAYLRMCDCVVTEKVNFIILRCVLCGCGSLSLTLTVK
jgi:hypothetical protein